MCDDLRMNRNSISKEIGGLMAQGKKEEAEAKKEEVNKINEKLMANEGKEANLKEEIKERMMKIPNIMDATVPTGKDDSENVENEKFGEPVVPEYEIPYHADILFALNKQYEVYHGITINEQCIDDIIGLSSYYLPSRVFPDKAIDVLDEVGAISNYKNIDNLDYLIDFVIHQKLNVLPIITLCLTFNSIF